MKNRMTYLGFGVALLLILIAIAYGNSQNQKLIAVQKELAMYKELEYACSQQLTNSEKKLQATQILLGEYQQLFPETFMKSMSIDDSRIKEYITIVKE